MLFPRPSRPRAIPRGLAGPTPRAPRRLLPRPVVLAAMCVLLATAAALLGPTGPARADDGADAGASSAPVRMVLVTSGLTWEDVSEETTPHLQCLAENAGVGAMNTTSTTVVSTKRQGEETLRTGFRGLAATAPSSAGVPNPPTDQLARIPGGTTEIDASEDVPVGRISAALDGDGAGDADSGVLLVDLGSATPSDLTALDERAGEVLDAAGGCAADSASGSAAGSADLPRTLLVSVAATDPADPAAVETQGSIASRTAGLQVAMDTGRPGEALSSGSTHQNGLVVLTDVLPTVLESHGVEPTLTLPGQSFEGQDTRVDPQQLALDRSLAARLVDGASPPAFFSWLAFGAVGLVLLLITPLRRRDRARHAARSLLAIAPLCFPVALMSTLVPWWRAEHPALALTGVVWAGSAVLAAVVLAGPWRRSRFGPPGVAFGLVAGLILLESALGSPWQTGSPLGANAISGARFYGLSNHLFGMVLAGTLAALGCLFTRLRTPRARVIATVATGVVVSAACVAPSMGADFGSMLVCVPTFGLLALLVSGIPLRWWHVLGLYAAGAVAVVGVSVLDWLRPPASRSHLGRFIDDVLSGGLGTVVLRKLGQNLQMLVDYPGLALVVLAAVLGSVAILMPRRLHWRALEQLDEEHPSGRSVRIALVAGGWLGYAVNDTGPVLIAAVLGLGILALAAVLPAREDAPVGG
ncbi:hypothetical protein Bra3105_14340 [Brachybacterium halotolerans subsp. kimchii]|uniref:hypothetical protein n=1 Tax=Brachybacterium halotolerans TaxID=2795215 RepID=UPI001E495019|nr:hypothetical protein [Brachybacterium halotolerans]UEJ82014.1 hypothetical protein Bra3105_14340 [Brachybacterium halotolerans subsp. kimchii]